jgi:preprotein translocase subunit SecE
MPEDTKKPENAVTDTQPVDERIESDGIVNAAPDTLGILADDNGVGEPSNVQVATQPAQLGAGRYVHAAFFAFATLSGYLSDRLFTSLWNWLAEWPFAVQHVPQLLRLSEDERGSVGSLVGVAVGLGTLFYFYKKPAIRLWAEEVAGELTKVTWPDRETVTNGTLIVIVASLVATVYVTLLDRLWGFATRLIYGS